MIVGDARKIEAAKFKGANSKRDSSTTSPKKDIRAGLKPVLLAYDDLAGTACRTSGA